MLPQPRGQECPLYITKTPPVWFIRAALVVYELPISDRYCHCPVPDRESDCGLAGLLSYTLKVALSNPVLLGVKNMASWQVPPAAIELPQGAE